MDISINQVVSDGSTTLCGCAFSSSSETWYTGNSLGEVESLTQGSSGCEADEDAITAIAVSPDGADMILGFQNKVSSRHVNNPSDENHGQLMRTNLAARQIEFNSTGSHVFIATEETDGIRVYSVNHKTVQTTLRSNDQAVRAFCLDDSGDYLAMINGNGDLLIYRLVSDTGVGKEYVGSNNVCMKIGLLDKSICRDYETGFSMSFSRYDDSLHLAIPQPGGSPMVLTRVSTAAEDKEGDWKEIATLVTDEYEKVRSHLGKHISLVAFSPNGRYLASSDVDGRILVWDMSTTEVVDAKTCEEELLSIKWGPCLGDNYLMVLTKKGWGRVDDIIPSTLCPPTGDIVDTETAAQSMVEASPAKETAPEVDSSLHPQKDLKRIRKVSAAAGDGDDSEDEIFEFDGGVEDVKSSLTKKNALVEDEADAVGDSEDEDDVDDNGIIIEDEDQGVVYDPAVGGISQFLQDPFQPSSTAPDEKKRRYMVWNSVGTIISRDDDISNRIEIKFADMSSSNKQESFADNYGFTIADMSSDGAIFAAPPDEPEPNNPTDDGLMPPPKTAGSVVFYRSFGNKMKVGGANENFTHTLSAGEEAVAVCAGSGWCAVATSKNFLRVFSSTGLQISITLLKGPVVCLCGHGSCLAVIYNSSGCTVETPILLVDMLDVSSRGRMQGITKECVLPLSSQGTLAWAAFSEDKYLVALDSNGMLYALLCTMGWQWVPVLDTSALCRTVDHKVWPIVVKAERFCYALLHGEKKPVVFPQPVVTARPFKLPLLEGKEGRDKTESERHRELLWRSIQLSHVDALNNHSMAVGAEEICGLRVEDLEEEISSMQLERDKLLIRQFHDCCKKQRLAAALDAMSRISTLNGLRSAITVANALGKASLAKILSEMAAEKEALEEGTSSDSVDVPSQSQTTQPASESVSSYRPREDEEDPYHYSYSQTHQASSSGYSEQKSPGADDLGEDDDSDRRLGQSRFGSGSVLGAKRRSPQDSDKRRSRDGGDVSLPINKFAQSSIVSPFKKRRDVYESMSDLKASPSPKKPPLQRDSSFAKEARSKRLHDKSVI